MFYVPLSLDISGVWSERNALQMIAQLSAEALERKIVLKAVTIPEIKGNQNVMIRVFCARHDRPILSDSACDECANEK